MGLKINSKANFLEIKPIFLQLVKKYLIPN